MRLDCIRQHTFLAGLLAPGATVLDLGGNRGDFARAICARYRARCVVVEASPDLCAAMARVDGMRVLNYAIGDKPGTATLHLAANSEASSVGSAPTGAIGTREVPAIDLPGLAAAEGLECIDLLKMDIEGSEIAVLRSLPKDFLARVAQLTVEFHDFAGSPLSEIREVTARLEGAGFAAVRFSRRNHSDVLFINRHRVPLSAWSLLWLRKVQRNVAGLRRVAARALGRG